MYSFPNLEPVHCSMSGSNSRFLTCIQISQEGGKVVWYSHLLKNFPQFVVIHTIKCYNIANEAEIDVFLESSLLFTILQKKKTKKNFFLAYRPYQILPIACILQTPDLYHILKFCSEIYVSEIYVQKFLGELKTTAYIYVCINILEYIYMCVYTHTHTHTHTHICFPGVMNPPAITSQ